MTSQNVLKFFSKIIVVGADRLEGKNLNDVIKTGFEQVGKKHLRCSCRPNG